MDCTEDAFKALRLLDGLLHHIDFLEEAYTKITGLPYNLPKERAGIRWLIEQVELEIENGNG